MSTQPARLDRRLGPIDAAAIVVSNVIGGGIFFVPILVAQLVPDARGLLIVWVSGGVLSMAGAMAYAELAALRPHAGGEYVYLRAAFGPLVGFLSGWTSFVAGFSGAIAASAVALAEYVGRFAPGAGDAAPLVTIPLPLIPLVLSRKSLVALAAIWLLTAIHHRGLGPGRLVQNLLAAVKVSALLLFVTLGLTGGRGTVSNLGAPGAMTASGFLLALLPVMFAYSGWNAASYVSEEIRDPERNVPRALGLGTMAVILVYLGLNAAFLYAMPLGEIAAFDGTLIDTVAERLFGTAVGAPIAIFTIVSIAASISAMILAGPRVYFAMARDGLFAARAGRVHPRFRAPTNAILAQTVWSSVLVLSGTLAQLVSYTGFALMLFSSLAVLSVFVLRRQDASAGRPFETIGYPWAPALFVGVGALVVANEMWRNPGPAFAGLAIILVGVPIYLSFRRRRADR